MFRFILPACLLSAVAITSAIAPAGRNDAIEVTSYGNQVNPDGTYGYHLELSNGVTIQESGIGGQYATGGFRHYSPEGELVEVAYTADESGFQPQGPHLPTPPPVPEHILRAIRYIEQHPTKEEQLDRQLRQKYAA